MEVLTRKITPLLLSSLKVSPIVFLNGPRQSGKSTLVQSISSLLGKGEPAEYVTFDKPTQMAAAAAAPEDFLSGRKGSLIIDEVQMVPELFRALKTAVDQERLNAASHVSGKYLLTGSANILALPKLSDPLVGRMVVLTLYPFCTAEATGGAGNGLSRLLDLNFDGIQTRDISLTEAIKSATFPEVLHLDSEERAIWFDGYLTTLLQRDVRMLSDLEKIATLPNLLRILAARAGSMINDSDISRAVGLNAVTGKFYRNILKMMFLNFDLPPWYRNIGKRLVKAPKGYLADTLLLCHVVGLDLEEMDRRDPILFGHLLENYVATELVKLLSFSNSRAKLLHFRTSDGKEVDFLLERPDGTLLAIEVKKSDKVAASDFKGIKTLAELAPDDFSGGVVLYRGNEVIPFGKKLWAVPLSILWQ